MAYNNNNQYNNNTYDNNPNTFNQTDNATPTTHTTSQQYPTATNNNNNDNDNYNNNDNWKPSSGPSASNFDQTELRLTIFLTILLVYIVFNLIPYAITNDNSSNNEAYFSVKLAGFCIAFIGTVIPFFMYHFNVNGCANNHSRLVNKICGGVIIIGGLLLLIGNIIQITENSETNPICDDDTYICCTCIPLSLLCVFACLLIILVGVDLVSDYLNQQKTRIGFLCAVFILGIVFILIPMLANDINYGAVGEAVIVGYFGIIIFSVLAIIAVFIGNGPMGKYVGILFGCSILLTLYSHSVDRYDNDHVIYVAFGGFIVYDLVN